MINYNLIIILILTIKNKKVNKIKNKKVNKIKKNIK